MIPDLGFWVSIRQALLTAVDAVERLVNAGLEAQKRPPKFEPRTAELRKAARGGSDDYCTKAGAAKVPAEKKGTREKATPSD